MGVWGDLAAGAQGVRVTGLAQMLQAGSIFWPQIPIHGQRSGQPCRVHAQVGAVAAVLVAGFGAREGSKLAAKRLAAILGRWAWACEPFTGAWCFKACTAHARSRCVL